MEKQNEMTGNKKSKVVDNLSMGTAPSGTEDVKSIGGMPNTLKDFVGTSPVLHQSFDLAIEAEKEMLKRFSQLFSEGQRFVKANWKAIALISLAVGAGAAATSMLIQKPKKQL